jgi:hypothetical protein
LLRPGGAVVTTVRLHPRNSWQAHVDDEPVDAGAREALVRVTDAVTDFSLRLRERAAGWQRVIGADLDELSDAAREYAVRITSNDLGDVAEVLDQFHEHGLSVPFFDVAKVDGELVPTEYLRLVARKI